LELLRVVCTSGQPGQPAAHKALRLVAAPAAPERRSPQSQALGHWCRMSMARRWEPTAVALSCQTAKVAPFRQVAAQAGW